MLAGSSGSGECLRRKLQHRCTPGVRWFGCMYKKINEEFSIEREAPSLPRSEHVQQPKSTLQIVKALAQAFLLLSPTILSS
jgi:hypothetical protein